MGSRNVKCQHDQIESKVSFHWTSCFFFLLPSSLSKLIWYEDNSLFFFFFTVFLLSTLLQMSLFSHPLPTSPSSLWPSPHCCLCLWVMHICSLANPFLSLSSTPTPLPSDSCQSAPSIHGIFKSVFIYKDSKASVKIKFLLIMLMFRFTVEIIKIFGNH